MFLITEQIRLESISCWRNIKPLQLTNPHDTQGGYKFPSVELLQPRLKGMR